MELDPSLDLDIPVLDWVPHLAMRTQGVKSSAIREILKLLQQPGLISFAGGLPAPDQFPLREIEEACRYIVGQEGANALQYSATEHRLPPRIGFNNPILAGFTCRSASIVKVSGS
jgi:DNA-binding transcriptional MocR family regulator